MAAAVTLMRRGAEVVPAARKIGRGGEEWRGDDGGSNDGNKGDASGQGRQQVWVDGRGGDGR